MSKEYTLKDLYDDLRINGTDYETEQREWHKNLLQVVEIINNNKDKDLKAVLNSDIDLEKDFLYDCNLEMVIDYDINGVLIYHIKKN